jgi:hypothetical protein
MSSVAQTAILPKTPQMEKVIEFSPNALRAPFFLRCAALFIDYMVLLAVPVTWLVVSRFLGDGLANVGISNTVWLFVLIAWVINFLALPLFSRPDNWQNDGRNSHSPKGRHSCTARPHIT